MENKICSLFRNKPLFWKKQKLKIISKNVDQTSSHQHIVHSPTNALLLKFEKFKFMLNYT